MNGLNVFVYGTLKRGQCRERCWPRKPLAVRPGWVRGQLFDLGAYPAARFAADSEGTWDWIAGELWSFNRQDAEITIAALDAIEETNQPGRANLYDRVEVDVFPDLEAEDTLRAVSYSYSRCDALMPATRIVPGPHRVPGGHGIVAWPGESEQ